MADTQLSEPPPAPWRPTTGGLTGSRASRAAPTVSADPDVEIIWAPVRRGCGQDIAGYFRDAIGHIVEFSAEEELILRGRLRGPALTGDQCAEL